MESTVGIRSDGTLVTAGEVEWQSLPGKEKCMRNKMWIRRLAGLLAAVLFAFSQVQSVYAWFLPIPGQDSRDYEEPEVIFTQLEELPAPTEAPAKGYFGMKIAKEKITEKDGAVSYRWQETYLPVITDDQKRVYGKLDSLTELLGIHLYIAGRVAKVWKHHTAVYLTLGSPIAAYETPFFTVQSDLQSAPLYFEEHWYVPLDAFLEITGAYRIYEGETTADTKQLVVVQPEETVLDCLADYEPFRYSKYQFDFYELGYTEDTKAVMKGSELLMQLVDRLARLDGETWRASAMTYLGMDDIAVDVVSREYIEKFMDAMLMMDKEQAKLLYDSAEKSLDIFGAVMDCVMSGQEKSMLDTLERTKEILLYENPAAKLSNLSVLEEGYAQASAMSIRDKASLGAATALKYFISYRALAVKLENGDDWMEKAGKQFLKDVQKLESPAMDSFTQSVVRDRIDAFESKGDHGDAILSWLSQNYGQVIADGLAFLEKAYFGTVTKASFLWGLTTDLFYGRFLDASELELAAVYGELYQNDAMAVTDLVLSQTFSQNQKNWTAEDEKRLRMALSNEVKAAYVTRSFAMEAENDDHLIYYPGVKARMSGICRELNGFLADFSDPDKRFGLMPQELSKMGSWEEKHYPNVIFNIAELSGEILTWGTEKPAKNVKIEIHDVDGTLLAEGETDQDGMFDIAFELGDIDSLEREDGAVRKLNLHLYYKNDPVIMQVAELKAFHKYQVDGLRAGERTQEKLVYLREAREEEGKTVLMVQEIDLGEKPWSLDVPDLQGGVSYTAYFSLHGDTTLSEWKSYVLRDKVSFGSVYSVQTPENGLLDNMLYLTENIGGMYPECFTWRKMHTVEEINTFIETYRNYVNDDPVYVLTTVNSEVKEVEPSIVNPK